MNTQIVAHITKLITDRLNERNWKTLADLNQLTNHINSVAQHELKDDPKLKEGNFSLMYFEEYGAIKQAVRKHLKALQANATKPMNENKKKALSENVAIPTPKSILNYTDSDVIAEIKKLVTGKFELQKIQSNADKIYNVIIKQEIEDADGMNFEFERYKYIQDVHKFRVDFFTDLSKKFPVVNVNLAAFEFVKGQGSLRFALSILISDTNIKDWVSGKKNDEAKKEKNKKIFGEAKKTIKESIEQDFAFLDETPTPLEEQYKKGRLYRLNEGLVFQTVEFVEYKNGRFLFENITNGQQIYIQPSMVQEKIEHVTVTLDETVNQVIKGK